MKYVYKIDHYYNIDHDLTNLLIATDIVMYDLANILAVIQLRFEELIDEAIVADEQHILMLLQKYYGVEDVKEQYKKYLPLTMLEDDEWELINIFELMDIQIIQIDLYEARELNNQKYYKGELNNFLPDNIKDFDNEIKNLRNYYLDM